jgi:hypothetical protein
MGGGRVGGDVVGRQRDGGRREAENQDQDERRESCHARKATTTGMPNESTIRFTTLRHGLIGYSGTRRRGTDRLSAS